MQNIFFNWEVSDISGWGIYGLNLLYWTLRKPNYRAVSLNWLPKFLYPVDPLAYKILKEVESTWKEIAVKDGDILLSSSVNRARRPTSEKCRQWNVIFFETKPLQPPQIDNLKTFDGVIVGSSWNKDALYEMGVDSRLVLQGVDTDLLRPLTKRLFKDRFVVFSGGKLEFRKGQGLALKAFSVFGKKYRDALFITAWRTPYDLAAGGINPTKICTPLQPEQDMKKAINDWVRANGVDENQFLNLDSVANRLMPEVL